MIILFLAYVVAGVAVTLFHPGFRAPQGQFWSQKPKGYEYILKPLLGVFLFVMMVVTWPVGLIKQRREQRQKQKLAVLGTLFGAGVEFRGGDGSNPENAIVIVGASEVSGVGAEHRWLRKHYPDCRVISQAVLKKGDQAYDMLEFETKSAERKTVYFNITSFFGVR